MINNLTQQNSAFVELQNDQLENIIKNGHFYYTSKINKESSGKRVDDKENFIENIQRKTCIPYNFKDADTLSPESSAMHMSAANKMLPIFAQCELKISDINNMKKLGISIIDSYYGEQLTNLYRKNSNESPGQCNKCDLNELIGEQEYPDENLENKKLSLDISVVIFLAIFNS